MSGGGGLFGCRARLNEDLWKPLCVGTQVPMAVVRHAASRRARSSLRTHPLAWAAALVVGAACATTGPAAAVASTDPVEARRVRAEYFRKSGMIGLSLTTLTDMRDQDQLGPDDLEVLARLQAYAGNAAEAQRTFTLFSRTQPGALRQKLLEVELLVLAGKEMPAAELMDKLINDFPSAPGPHIARARYFLARNRPDLARADLEQLGLEDRERPEAQELLFRVDHPSPKR